MKMKFISLICLFFVAPSFAKDKYQHVIEFYLDDKPPVEQEVSKKTAFYINAPNCGDGYEADYRCTIVYIYTDGNKKLKVTTTQHETDTEPTKVTWGTTTTPNYFEIPFSTTTYTCDTHLACKWVITLGSTDTEFKNLTVNQLK